MALSPEEMDLAPEFVSPTSYQARGSSAPPGHPGPYTTFESMQHGMVGRQRPNGSGYGSGGV